MNDENSSFRLYAFFRLGRLLKQIEGRPLACWTDNGKLFAGTVARVLFEESETHFECSGYDGTKFEVIGMENKDAGITYSAVEDGCSRSMGVSEPPMVSGSETIEMVIERILATQPPVPPAEVQRIALPSDKTSETTRAPVGIPAVPRHGN